MPENLWATDGGVYFGYQVAAAEDAENPLQGDWAPARNQHRYTGDRHLVTVGPNGSGKTRRLLIPNLAWLQNWSILVVDPKGTLAALTGPYRASLPGHTVIVIDPFGVLERDYPRLVARYPFLKSSGFNPVAALDPQTDDFPDDAKGLAEAIIRVEDREHPHWERSAQSLTAGLLMCDRIESGAQSSLVAVRDWVGAEAETLAREIKDNLLPLARHCDAIPAKLNRFTKISGENRELFSILSTAQTQTEWLDSVPIRRDVSKEAVDFGMMKFQPMTVYLILPPRYLASHSTWLRLMVTAVLQPLMRTVRPAKVPVLFMLDEFAQLGHLPIIENNLDLMREYGVKLWPVFQDLAQAKDIYKTRWESFVGNAGVLHSFAPQDATTRDYLSKLSGLRLYWIDTFSKSGGRSGGQQLSFSSGWQEGSQHLQGPIYWPQKRARPQRTGASMPIRPEMRGFYPSDWALISRRVRFERAGGVCQGCGRPHGETVRCLPDGRWFDATWQTWRNGRGRLAREPDPEEATRMRQTRVVLAAAHLDHDPANNRLRNLKSLCQRCHLIHDRPQHLARRRITYLLRRALGDLFLGPYAGFEATPDLVRAAFSAGTTRNL